jgi:hypothetical protein
MHEQFMPNASPAERLDVLRNTADSVTEEPQYVALSKDDLDQRREDFTTLAVKLNNLDMEKKDFMALHKEKVRPIKEEYDETLEVITIGKEKRTGTFYNLVSEDDKTMVTYDAEGNWVSERRLTPEEKTKQSRLFIPTHKNGTGTGTNG